MKVTICLVLCLSAVSVSQARPEPPSAQYGVPNAGGGGGGYDSGKPGGGGGYGKGGGDDLAEDTNYNFEYEVKDGESNNDFGHMEAKNGHTVTGVYHVMLPDGRMQVVKYEADWQSGYKPTVTYTGEAKYGPGVGGGKTNGGGGGGGGYLYRR